MARGAGCSTSARSPRWLSWNWHGLTGGYHGFCVADGLWSAISSAGQMLTGHTPDALSQAVRAHWQALQ